MERNKIPDLVKKVQLALYHKQPIPPHVIENVLELYPQYFPKEVERKKMWGKVPDSVKEAYTKEWQENHKKLFGELDKKVPQIPFSIDPKAEELKLKVEYEQLKLKEKAFEKKLYRKYYEKYGIKYDE